MVISTKKGCIILHEQHGLVCQVPVQDPSLLLALPEGRILMSTSNSLGIVVDLHGMPCGNPVLWNCPPVSLASAPPFLVSLLEDSTLQVSTLDKPEKVVESRSSGFATGLVPGLIHSISGRGAYKLLFRHCANR